MVPRIEAKWHHFFWMDSFCLSKDPFTQISSIWLRFHQFSTFFSFIILASDLMRFSCIFFKFLSLHRFHQFYLSFSSFSYTQLNCGWTKGSEVWTTGTLPIEHLFSISYIFTCVSDQPYWNKHVTQIDR